MKVNEPKPKLGPFGVQNRFYVEFDDGTKSMVDAVHHGRFYVGMVITTEQEIKGGWLNINKNTPFEVIKLRKNLYNVPFEDIRHTFEGLEFDVEYEGDRYVGRVPFDGHSHPILNVLHLSLVAEIRGVWTEKAHDYTYDGERGVERYWLLTEGSIFFDRKEHDIQIASGLRWGELLDMGKTSEFVPFSRILDLLYVAGVDVTRRDLLTALRKNAEDVKVLDFLFTMTKEVYLNLYTREWAFACPGGYVITIASIGMKSIKYNVAIPSLRHPDKAVASVVNTRDYDLWMAEMKRMWE